MRLVLNADLGEGEPEERTRELMECIGAANIACGGHAGSLETMERVVAMAAEHGVLVGAHPGTPGGFGRGVVNLEAADLETLLHEQVGALRAIAPLHHVKLHGGLYHATERDAELAERYCEVLRRDFSGVKIFALAGGRVMSAAESAGVEAWGEVFADRGYGADGRLIPRGQAGDLISEVGVVAERVAGWARMGWLGARTVCVHADSPGAVEMARAVTGVFL